MKAGRYTIAITFMLSDTIETDYPISFHGEMARDLGAHLLHRYSVSIIGMPRVGISNFLRFFLFHKGIVPTYISKEQKHLFIPVDLNDLIERELFPFWTLTLKRIVDSVNSSTLSLPVKKKIESIFLSYLQTQDMFLLLDSIRQAILLVVSEGIYPTIFFIRFDRIKNAATPAFFDNLQGLADATNRKLSFVVTSYRSLDTLSPDAFPKRSLSVFFQQLFLRPAREKDMRIIYNAYKKRFNLGSNSAVEKGIFSYVNGHNQYLQTALILLREKKQMPESKGELLQLLLKDERVQLESDELWEGLTLPEKAILYAVSSEKSVNAEEKEEARYLWDTGYIEDKNGKQYVFSPLLAEYVRDSKVDARQIEENIHFTKKENALFTLLNEFLDQICERERIIESVWPEYTEIGVSDWSVDRLIARVRTKLKRKKEPYEIMTIRTRGYKLIKTS